MQVRARSPACAAGLCDELLILDGVARFNQELACVGVACDESIAVINEYLVTVFRIPASFFDDASPR